MVKPALVSGHCVSFASARIGAPMARTSSRATRKPNLGGDLFRRNALQTIGSQLSHVIILVIECPCQPWNHRSRCFFSADLSKHGHDLPAILRVLVVQSIVEERHS